MRPSRGLRIMVMLLLLPALGFWATAATGDAGTSPTARGFLSPSGTVFLPLILSRPVEPVTLHPRWLRSLVIAPGETGRLLGITNEGYLMSSTDRGESWTVVPLPDEITGNGRTLAEHRPLSRRPGTTSRRDALPKRRRRLDGADHFTPVRPRRLGRRDRKDHSGTFSV